MDEMSWKLKRDTIQSFKAHPTHSTNLKKKQSLINKLKNLANENFQTLQKELENENLNKFHTEIVNNLLLNPLVVNPSLKFYKKAFVEIHKIVEIIYMFSFDNLFFSYLTTTLKRIHSQNWVLSCIFIEVFALSNKLKKTNIKLEDAVKPLLKSIKDTPLAFVLYMLEFFEINPGIFVQTVEDEMQKANTDTIDLLKTCCCILGIDADVRVDTGFKQIITPYEGEFDFYEDCKTEKNISNRETSLENEVNRNSHVCFGEEDVSKVVQTLVKNIENKHYSKPVLDFIGQHVYDRPEMIKKLVKKRKHVDFIPSLARIISNAFKYNKKVVDSVFNYKITEVDLMLICECFKFGVISATNMFSMLKTFIEHNQIDKICTVLYTAGRFMLYKQETNNQTVELMKKLGTMQLDGVSKISVAHCISTVLTLKCSKTDILDFFRWFFNEFDYENSGLFNEMINSSKRILMIVFAQPDLFEDKKRLYKAIEAAKMYETMSKFYFNSIETVYKHSKVYALAYVHVLGCIIKSINEQYNLIDRILKIKLEEKVRVQMAIHLLDCFDSKLHEKYLPALRERSRISKDCVDLLFNFCEKYHYDVVAEDDSIFDREMMLMYDSD